MYNGLIFTFVLALSACKSSQGVAPQRPVIPERDVSTSSAVLYNSMEFVEDPNVSLRPPQDRPGFLKADQLLTRIHSRLTLGRGVRQVRMAGGWEILLLDPHMPESILKQIESNSFDDQVFDSGIAILQKSFWKSMIEIRKMGDFKIGFISRSPLQSAAAGVYFSGLKTVAFDIYANTGTVRHEMRHHTQFQRRRYIRGELDSNCIERFQTFLGELDATMTQVNGWKKSVLDLPVIPSDYEGYLRLREAGVSDEQSMVLPGSLLANLNYPRDAASDFLSSEACPDSIQEVVRELRTDLQSFIEPIQDPVIELSVLRAQAFTEYAHYQGLDSETYIQGLKGTLREQKNRIVSQLDTILQQRPSVVRTHLRRLLNQQYIRQLRGEIGAFELLIEPESERIRQ